MARRGVARLGKARIIPRKDAAMNLSELERRLDDDEQAAYIESWLEHTPRPFWLDALLAVGAMVGLALALWMRARFGG
jgi:hypothetical protein